MGFGGFSTKRQDTMDYPNALFRAVDSAREALATSNLSQWERTIDGVEILVSPYIKEEHQKELDDNEEKHDSTLKKLRDDAERNRRVLDIMAEEEIMYSRLKKKFIILMRICKQTGKLPEEEVMDVDDDDYPEDQ